MSDRTFTIIKPNSVAKGDTGRIIDRLISEGFTLRAMKTVVMSRNDAARFYAVHRGKPFFEELLDFMTSGASVVAILEKKDAVKQLRRLVGDTDPASAEPGTIRREFGESKGRNAIHASDSDENALMEWSQFFGPGEIIECDYKG